MRGIPWRLTMEYYWILCQVLSWTNSFTFPLIHRHLVIPIYPTKFSLEGLNFHTLNYFIHTFYSPFQNQMPHSTELSAEVLTSYLFAEVYPIRLEWVPNLSIIQVINILIPFHSCPFLSNREPHFHQSGSRANLCDYIVEPFPIPTTHKFANSLLSFLSQSLTLLYCLQFLFWSSSQYLN